ncbi:LysR family transcriptional regulator [Kiloniella majae]|uniref:LysR family transcriptional regulator n=1 Tax=Kiloniella majae TaxID=1938558 RepID=UPI000A276F4C|nr:LysR family transcriptional regulator [Kiloniella majae]
MSFDIKSLELFVRIAALNAIGRAGEEFDLSATATTQRIQMLEANIGSKLLNRTTRAVSLTSDGEIFLAHAKQILEAVEAAHSAMSSSTENVSGELRVTTSASFGRNQIIPYVAEFLEQHPKLSLKLSLSDTTEDIIERGFDLAIRVGSLKSSSLIARKLANNPRVLVASPTYLQKHGIPETPQDLTGHNCIVLGETHNWTLIDKNKTAHEIQVSGNFSTNLGDSITDVISDGVGIGLKSLWDVSTQIKTGILVPILDEYTIGPDWQIWAVRPPSRLMPARVQAFLDFFEKKFQTKCYL